jgi:zinc transporter
MSAIDGDAGGRLWAFAFDGGEPRQAEVFAAPAQGWLWAHFRLGDNAALRTIDARAELPAEARTLFAEVDQRPQIQFADGWAFGVLPDVERDLDGRDVGPGRLLFAAGPHLLVTGRRHPQRGASDLRHACQAGAALANPTAAVVELIERYVERSEARLREMSASLDLIEDRVLNEADERDLKALAPLRRAASRGHREFLALRSALHRAAAHRRAGESGALREELPRLALEAEDLDRESASLQERTRLLHEEIDTQINSAINRSMRALAIISTLLIPPTLITGAFGMNVPGLPFTGSPVGFSLATLICLLAVAVSWLVLKRMRVL